MKKLTCEMCGSSDIIKQDGVFVCQSCGCKYSVEEAKKMMVEGTVEVKGKVEVDSSKRLENLYQIARRARSDGNAENAAKYYEMILVDDPNSWEASFYAVYFKAMSCKVAQIESAAISISNCFDSVLSLIRKYVSDERAQLQAVMEIVHCSVRASHILRIETLRNYKPENSKYFSNFSAANNILFNLGDEVDSVFGQKAAYHKISVDLWKQGIEQHKEKIKRTLGKDSDTIVALYLGKVEKYDQAYVQNVKDDKRKKEIQNQLQQLNEKIVSLSQPTKANQYLFAVATCLISGVLLCILAFLAKSWFLFVLSGIPWCLVYIYSKVLSQTKENSKKLSDAIAQKEALEKELKKLN